MEWAIVNDEGVVEDGFFSKKEAESALVKHYDADDSLSIAPRSEYDECGQWIEDEDEDEDED